jgi:hypothetical protein
LKYSPQIALPPIFTGELDVRMLPLTATDDTWVPFTYRRSVVPSNVNARCVHVPVGTAAVPSRSFAVLPTVTCDCGRFVSEFA